MKTIGVLGGLGPQATMDFEARIHAVSQRLIPQRQNQGYPPMVVYYYRHAAVVLADDGSPVRPAQPDPRLFEAAKKLGSWADFLVITSNSPHRFRDLIEEVAGCKVLSLVDVTLEEVRRRQLQKVGVLELGKPKIYHVPLSRLGIAYETLADELRKKLDEAILAFMEGRPRPVLSAVASAAVDVLRARSLDGIILGCTEIPLLLGESANDPDLINPAQLLAEAAVRYALE